MLYSTLTVALTLAAVFSSTSAQSPEPSEEEILTAYPSVNGTNILGTRLYGFDGCNDAYVHAIKTAFDDFKTLANTEGVLSNIDWNSATALEYLGPPGFNKRQRDKIQAVFANAATVYPGSIFNPFSNWIRVRCNDPRRRCPESNNGEDPCAPPQTPPPGQTEKPHAGLNAYSLNEDPDKPEHPMINFCKRFFDKKSTLEHAYRRASTFVGAEKFNLANYENQAETMFHELLHLNFVADSVGGRPNPIVDDLHITMSFRSSTGKDIPVENAAYGPTRCKLLARFKPEGTDHATGFYVQRNADNLVWYAMAKYVPGPTRYPHMPVVREFKLTLPPYKKPNPILEYKMTNDGLLFLPNELLDPVYPCNDRLDDDTTAVNMTLGAAYDESDYPADYLVLAASWRGAESETPSVGQLANPRCQSELLTEGIHAVSRKEAADMIDQFCSNKRWWNVTVVSAVAMNFELGLGGKTPQISDSSLVNNDADKLYFDVSWKAGCVGTREFTLGDTDAEKKSHCSRRFLSILDGCDKTSTTAKHGGGLADGCLVYRMGAVATDAREPFTVFEGGPEFVCSDADPSANPSFANACMCHFTGEPQTVAAFDKPQGGCGNLTTPPPKTFEE